MHGPGHGRRPLCPDLQHDPSLRSMPPEKDTRPTARAASCHGAPGALNGVWGPNLSRRWSRRRSSLPSFLLKQNELPCAPRRWQNPWNPGARSRGPWTTVGSPGRRFRRHLLLTEPQAGTRAGGDLPPRERGETLPGTPAVTHSPRLGAQASYDHRMKAKEKNKNKNRN